jgi:hypothetical protein
MATRVESKFVSSMVRVGLVIGQGKLKPVWFERIDHLSSDRIFIKEIYYSWIHQEGAAKIINFKVYDGSNSYGLSLNTRDFTWSMTIAERTEI